MIDANLDPYAHLYELQEIKTSILTLAPRRMISLKHGDGTTALMMGAPQ